MTFLDMIQMWNMTHGNELNDVESILDGVELDERLDRGVLAGVLLDECGAMRCIYETTATFKYFSDNFFKKYAWNIEKLLNTLDFEYDPLKNKNLTWTETTSIEQNLDTQEEHDENKTRDNTGTQETYYGEDETNTISAMNSDNYQPDNKSEMSGNNTRTDNLSESIVTDRNRSKSEDLVWDETDTHTEAGTSDVLYQDLIKKEREVAQFSVYGWIAKKYAKELFLLVY